MGAYPIFKKYGGRRVLPGRGIGEVYIKKRWISVLLTLSLVAGSMFCFSFSAGATYYRDGQKIARADFVGWTGIVPISVLFEYVFGIKPDAQNNVIRWNVDLTDRFGVEKYPFGPDATLTLLCEERGDISEEPQVQIASDRPVTVEIYWDNGTQSKTVAVSGGAAAE